VAYTYASVAYLHSPWYFTSRCERCRRTSNLQLTLHVATDVVLIVILMYASSGLRSGLGVMLLISLAGAALVSRGTTDALLRRIGVDRRASRAVVLGAREDSSTANYVQPGLPVDRLFRDGADHQSAGAPPDLERALGGQQRGADLADQLRINRLIIRDVQDGVLVVDAHGSVHLHNPRAAICWGGSCPI